MEKRITGLNNLVFAGITALLMLSGCATTPAASNSKETTPQQLILQNRKEEAMQESGRCLHCDHFGYGIFKGGRVAKW